MKVVNDTSLTVGWLVGRVPPHRLCATCVVKGTYAIVQGGVAQLLEPRVQLAGDVPSEEYPLSLRYSGDLVPFKPFVDILLWATGYAPAGKPASAFPVEFSVGNWTKQLVLLGERRRVGGPGTSVITDPIPFSNVPVCYEMAFGGPSDPFNPAGLGAEEITDLQGHSYTPLPRVLLPDDIADDVSRSKKHPAGFGPIDPGWAGRMRKARRASFDSNWLETEWPGYPNDFDWSFFNAAPEDQQLPAGSLAGNEEVRLRNLHKSQGELVCRLPGARPRWFMLGTDGAFSEVPLRLDTLQVDAEAGRAALVWRGIAPLKSRRMNEVAATFIVQERLSERSLSAQHYQALLARRLKEIADATKVDPVPSFEIPPVEVEAPEFDVKSFESELNAEIAAARNEALTPDAESEAQFQKAMADSWVRGAGLRPQHFAPPPPAPPDVVAKSLADSHEALAAAHPPAASLIGPPPPAADLELPAWAVKNIAELDALNRGDHDGNEEPAEEDDGWTREKVQRHAAARGSFAEQDLTELNLSDLDLSSLDFTEAMFEGSKLANVNLSKATLTRATLVECDLTGADMKGAILDDADLSQTKAAGVSFLGALLRNATAIEADWAGADLRGVNGTRANLTGAKLSGIKARGSDFSEALFDDAILNEADFSRCTLKSAFATGAKAVGATFDSSDLTNFRGCNEADFSGANFQKVLAASSVFNASKLDKANFFEAVLDDSNFEEASLREAVFTRARMKKAKLADADLTLASLVQADLFHATFEGAKLIATDLRGANMFEAEFLDAETSRARWESANLRRTKLA